MDISTKVSIEGWQYDLEKFIRTKADVTESIDKEIVALDTFKKTGIQSIMLL